MGEAAKVMNMHKVLISTCFYILGHSEYFDKDTAVQHIHICESHTKFPCY